jgi:hypothetical protein
VVTDANDRFRGPVNVQGAAVFTFMGLVLLIAGVGSLGRHLAAPSALLIIVGVAVIAYALGVYARRGVHVKDGGLTVLTSWRRYFVPWYEITCIKSRRDCTWDDIGIRSAWGSTFVPYLLRNSRRAIALSGLQYNPNFPFSRTRRSKASADLESAIAALNHICDAHR